MTRQSGKTQEEIDALADAMANAKEWKRCAWVTSDMDYAIANVKPRIIKALKARGVEVLESERLEVINAGKASVLFVDPDIGLRV